MRSRDLLTPMPLHAEFHWCLKVGSLPCTQVANKFSEELYSVIYKRPSDLSLKADVPVCCNILICDMFDEGTSHPLAWFCRW